MPELYTEPTKSTQVSKRKLIFLKVKTPIIPLGNPHQPDRFTMSVPGASVSVAEQRKSCETNQVGTKLGTTEDTQDSEGPVSAWCERGDSNPHGFTRQILSLVRLPIPPLSHFTKSGSDFIVA